jgi:spore coat polysaccharide biosynthesis protein SpsF (cytidylyltransferase family)/predicted dehydrogenase
VATKSSHQRFLVAGCGSIGKRHIKNLLALGAGEVLAFDVRADRRDEVRSEAVVAVFEDLEEALQAGPTVVVIAAPTSLHVPVALRAAERNCHLFIEKPLSHSMKEVDRLIEEAGRRKLVTFVACNTRFTPGLSKIRELLDQRVIGRVLSARAEAGHYLPDWHPWEDYRHTYSARRALGGGIILDAVHEFDYLRWLVGEVEAVSCFSGKVSDLEIDTEDIALTTLRFANGALGEVHLDYLQRTYNRNCQIIGEKGTIRWDFAGGEVCWYVSDEGQWHRFAPPDHWEINDMYLEEMGHFVDCLEGKSSPCCDIHDGRRILEIALAAKDSAQSGRAVSLPAPAKKVVAIIQARMGSSRLPGKTLADIAGRPLLTRVIERTCLTHRLDEVMVATTTAKEDDAIEDVARRSRASVFRGEAQDVLDRYYNAARASRADIIVRITADDPFKDPDLIGEGITQILSDSSIDYVKADPCPEGLEVEVFTFAALEKSWREAKLPSEREHVTPYIWKHPDRFHLKIIRGPKVDTSLRLTLDYEQDLQFAREVYARLYREGRVFSLQDLVELVKAEPHLAELNSGIQSYAGYVASLEKDREFRDREKAVGNSAD